MLELARREFAGRTIVAVATERGDGDVHPERVTLTALAQRQVAITGHRWTMVDEVHGTAVHHSGDRDPDRAMVAVADVIVTDDERRHVAVWAADCAPVVLFDSTGRVIVAHAGWRGLSAGVIDVAVAEATGPIIAVLGPCIHPCCYEFGQRELDQVATGVGVAATAIASTTRTGRLALDVPRAVERALARHGIALEMSGACTGCDERWYSHRVRGDTGRHAVVAWSEAA